MIKWFIFKSFQKKITGYILKKKSRQLFYNLTGLLVLKAGFERARARARQHSYFSVILRWRARALFKPFRTLIVLAGLLRVYFTRCFIFFS